MKSHILVFLDDNGTEQSAPSTQVRFDGYNEFYNLMVVQVAERILQGEKYKDA